ncbi:MAG: Spx/MgsR family RNA polymerase-binding regulatory protein [Alphaproteobacteria bacterium]
MTLTVYHLKTCDTCRKAIKALKATGHDLALIDVRASDLSRSEIASLAKKAGWETLLNTRSTTWRGLTDADKNDMDAPKAIALMTAHPTLIKRPVIVNGETITVGWTPAVQSLY